MSQPEPNLPAPAESEASPPPSRSNPKLMMFLVAPALIAGGVFLSTQAGALWQEWNGLQDDLFQTEQAGVVGYLNIAPVAAFTEEPKVWYRHDDDHLFLWLGWEKETDQRWFRFAKGEIDPRRIYRPNGEFISRAIDFPLVETGGGTIWKRMTSETRVIGCKIEKHVCVYPVPILGKVIVINDIVDEHPYLIVENPFAKPVVAYSIYDTLLEGRRITLAHTGYFKEGKPILFDRGTESLWFEMHDGLTAIAGKHFRKRLNRVAIPAPVTWATWLSQNPESRLLVGADRTAGIPKE
jgi:hypothetical protein